MHTPFLLQQLPKMTHIGFLNTGRQHHIQQNAGDQVSKISCGEGDKSEQARRVFDALREFDHESVAEIYAQCPDAAGLGLAIGNRLKKAAGFHVVEV